MKNYKKIFAFTIVFFSLFFTTSYSEIVKTIEIKGNERISDETVLIFGDVALGKNYEISDVNSLIQKLYEVYEPIKNVDYPPFKLTQSESIQTASSRDELLDSILEAGKKGLYIQRYKGLGEMNPEQLWETTMNPEKRVLLQVRADDLIESDNLFSMLMGDEVEPRREFIQGNALEAKNLDI